MRGRLDVTHRDNSPCTEGGAEFSVVRGRLADSEEWTGTFVTMLHSHAVARVLRPARRTERTQ